MNMWFNGFMMQCNKIFMTWLNLGDFCENKKNFQKENIMRTMLALKHVKFIAAYKSISYLLKGHCISQCNVASIRHKWNFKSHNMNLSHFSSTASIPVASPHHLCDVFRGLSYFEHFWPIWCQMKCGVAWWRCELRSSFLTWRLSVTFFWFVHASSAAGNLVAQSSHHCKSIYRIK